MTIDFALRGFRGGWSMTGPLYGDGWDETRQCRTRRKDYSGRGWAQSLVDDVVIFLKEVMA